MEPASEVPAYIGALTSNDLVELKPVAPLLDPSAPPDTGRTIRLNAEVKEQFYRTIQRSFSVYGLSMSSAVRAGLGVLHAALPHLASGGELRVCGADGSEFVVSFKQSLGLKKAVSD